MSTEPLQPPPGATPEIAAILAAYTDPGHRDAIWRAWHALTEGVADHTIAQAGLLFAAIHRADRAQMDALLTTHATHVRILIDAARDAAIDAGHIQAPSTSGVPDGLVTEVRHAVAQEFAARWQRIGIAVAVVAVASFILGAWIFHR